MEKLIKVNLCYINCTTDEYSVFDKCGDCYLNPRHISQFRFEENMITLIIDSKFAQFEFNKKGMGEYQRIKREIKEFFKIE